jgi:hypothetical protein
MTTVTFQTRRARLGRSLPSLGNPLVLILKAVLVLLKHGLDSLKCLSYTPIALYQRNQIVKYLVGLHPMAAANAPGLTWRHEK